MRKRKNTVTKKLKNLKMNDEVFQLRRKVMGHVRDAKALLGDKFKRVEVRITEKHDRIAGLGRMGDCVIWIPEDTLKMSVTKQRWVVFHEIAHAIFAAEHDENCKLMHPIVQNSTKKQQDTALLKIANKV